MTFFSVYFLVFLFSDYCWILPLFFCFVFFLFSHFWFLFFFVFCLIKLILVSKNQLQLTFLRNGKLDFHPNDGKEVYFTLQHCDERHTLLSGTSATDGQAAREWRLRAVLSTGPDLTTKLRNSFSFAGIAPTKAPFATFGIPEVIVSDNGTQFTGHEFCTKLGIRYLRTAPFHPQSNGSAEQFVDLEEALQTLLQVYRYTPIGDLGGKSPAE